MGLGAVLALSTYFLLVVGATFSLIAIPVGISALGCFVATKKLFDGREEEVGEMPKEVKGGVVKEKPVRKTSFGEAAAQFGVDVANGATAVQFVEDAEGNSQALPSGSFRQKGVPSEVVEEHKAAGRRPRPRPRRRSSAIKKVTPQVV